MFNVNNSLKFHHLLLLGLAVYVYVDCRLMVRCEGFYRKLHIYFEERVIATGEVADDILGPKAPLAEAVSVLDAFFFNVMSFNA